MLLRNAHKLLIATQGLTLIFLFWSAAGLPPEFAAHFNAAGLPDRYSSRTAHLILMTLLIVGLPALVTGLVSAVLRADVPINVPHADYWLADQRKAATIAYLRSFVMLIQVWMVLFFGYTHILIVQANQAAVVQLPATASMLGLTIFLAGALGGAGMLIRHFARPPLDCN